MQLVDKQKNSAIFIRVSPTGKESQFNYFQNPNGPDELWIETRKGTVEYHSHIVVEECRRLFNQ